MSGVRIYFLSFIALSLSACPLFGQSSEVPKFEIGAQYSARGLQGTSTLSNGSTCFGCGVTASGIGARFVYNAFRFVSLEGEWNIYPSAGGGTATIQYGGTATEGLFGVKTGWRNNKFGLFAKAAPGYLMYSHAVVSSNSSINGVSFGFGTVTHFTQYFGAVAEYYPVRHIALRVDVGQTLTDYAAHPPVTSTSDWQRNGQVESGVSYRF